MQRNIARNQSLPTSSELQTMHGMNLSDKTETWCDGWRTACRRMKDILIDAGQKDLSFLQINEKLDVLEKQALNEAPTLIVSKPPSESGIGVRPSRADPRKQKESASDHKETLSVHLKDDS